MNGALFLLAKPGSITSESSIHEFRSAVTLLDKDECRGRKSRED